VARVCEKGGGNTSFLQLHRRQGFFEMKSNVILNYVRDKGVRECGNQSKRLLN